MAELINKYSVGFIGAGNMGGALARAAAKGTDDSRMIFISDKQGEKAEALAEALGANYTTTTEIAKLCDYIFIGVKPQMLSSLFDEIAPVLSARNKPFTLVSMAAGCAIKDIKRMAGGDYPVIRIMPNMPVSVGAGMILYSYCDKTKKKTVDDFLAFMSFAGKFDMLPEGLIDAGSALSGCGPAYAFMFIEALADGAVSCGLPRDKAVMYAAQTLCGSAELLIESGIHPGALKDAVCSPAGSTIEGVRVLENGGFRSLSMNAVTAAYKRTKELGK